MSVIDAFSVAERVAGAMRAVARARSKPHHAPLAVLREAFDASCGHHDGRVVIPKP